jgi:hypothetical protein
MQGDTTTKEVQGTTGLAAQADVSSLSWEEQAACSDLSPAKSPSEVGPDPDLRVPHPDLVLDPWPGTLPSFVVQPISPAYGVKPTLLVISITGLGAGLLGGLLSVSGPPLMICFAILGLNKDTIRALNMSYSILILPSRVAMFTSSASTFNIPVYGRQYLVTIIFALVGNLVGTYLRRFCDTNRIVQILLLLVLLSSSILLGALDDAAVAATFAIAVVAWAAFVLYMRYRPPVYHAGMAVVRGWVGSAWRGARGR